MFYIFWRTRFFWFFEKKSCISCKSDLTKWMKCIFFKNLKLLTNDIENPARKYVRSNLLILLWLKMIRNHFIGKTCSNWVIVSLYAPERDTADFFWLTYICNFSHILASRSYSSSLSKCDKMLDVHVYFWDFVSTLLTKIVYFNEKCGALALLICGYRLFLALGKWNFL